MPAQRRTRRSSEEIRTRLLNAARELFTEHGYEATTTRDICARAGVAQQQLFANFGSKEGIFDAALIGPLSELVERYIAAYDTTRQQAPIDERVAMLVNGLYDLATENRTILLAAVSRKALNNDFAPPSGLLDHIARTLHEMAAIEDRPPGIDVPAAIVTTAGMVFGVVLLQDMLYPAGISPFTRERLTKEMITAIVHGALNRPVDDP
jgi:AcrR family transcriptional regulator